MRRSVGSVRPRMEGEDRCWRAKSMVPAADGRRTGKRRYEL